MVEPQQRRPLGTILLESGRIDEADVDRVLEYQRTHGGFFGQALVSLGILSREETDWALASHFDVPFIFPNADAVDRDVARLVPADWALAHMAVPIVRAGKVITVVVADPLNREVIDELRARTGLQVDLALASATRVRELIHAVYDTSDVALPDSDRPVHAGDFVRHALANAAERFGVSIRGVAAIGWWRGGGELHRVPLEDDWDSALDTIIAPPPVERSRESQDGHVQWDATLDRAGTALPLEVEGLIGAGGAELLFRPLQSTLAAPSAAEIVLPTMLLTELRLLWRSGAARIAVHAERIEAARALLPLMPALAVGPHVRAVHVNETGEGGTAYTLRAEPGDAFAEMIAAYTLDAITIDVPATGFSVRGLLRAAPLTLVLLRDAVDSAVTEEWDVNWLLTISGEPGGYVWNLRALHR